MTRKLSDEHKAKISAAAKKRWQTEERRNKIAPIGSLPKRKHSPEAIEKMRVANKGRVRDPEKEAKRIAAIRASMKGKPISQEHKDKIRHGVLNSMEQRGKKNMFRNTAGEVAIANFLSSKGLRFATQHRVNNHAFDFYVPALHLLIEFDGAHHWDIPWYEKDVSKHPQLLAEQASKDYHQTMAAQALGFNVIRIFGKNAPGDSWHGTLEEQMNRTGFGRLLYSAWMARK